MKAQAAVAVVEYHAEEPEYLLMERAVHPDDPWSGHLAFPGGKFELEDNSLYQTAVRECFEECGFALSQDEFVSELSIRSAGKFKHQMSVAPFLFRLDYKPLLILEESEVANAYWISRQKLLNKSEYQFKALSDNDTLYPCIQVENSLLWGFTLNVLIQYLGIKID